MRAPSSPTAFQGKSRITELFATRALVTSSGHLPVFPLVTNAPTVLSHCPHHQAFAQERNALPLHLESTLHPHYKSSALSPRPPEHSACALSADCWQPLASLGPCRTIRPSSGLNKTPCPGLHSSLGCPPRPLSSSLHFSVPPPTPDSETPEDRDPLPCAQLRA